MAKINNMDKYCILLVAAATLNLAASVPVDDASIRFDSAHDHRYHPPHHWHDCGSSEADWNKGDNGRTIDPWRDSNNWDWGNNNGAWVYPDERPRPPWPRPKPPRPTPSPPPTSPRPTPTPTSPKPVPTPTSPTPMPTPTSPRPIPTPTSPKPPLPTSTKKPEDLQTCLRNCPVTSEYNPVCGTDGVTYSNVGRLECAKFCGVDVKLARASQCSTTDKPTTASPPTPTTPSNTVKACIAKCPTTPEFNPVCGSDGVTYMNPGRLECAKMCGVNVQLSRKFPCPTNQPVTSSTASPTSSTASSNGGTDFTISQDILDLIFTDSPDIDIRFQDDE